jgi:predicted transcriptional regulator of viral defense system
MAGLSSQERTVLDTFAAAEKPSVGAADVIALLGVSRPYANRILERLAEKGWLLRLRRGVYSLVPLGAPSPEASVEDAWPLAMTLFSPAYISGWTAAEHWDLTEQVHITICVVTARALRRREQLVAGIKFVCRVVDERQLFGITAVRSGRTQVLVADPDRLIIDILAAPSLGAGGRQAFDIARAYFRSKHANLDRLLEYAERYGKGVVFKRLGFVAERLAAPSSEWVARCQAGMSAGISELDPASPARGDVVTRWRLRINIPLTET